MNNLNASTTKHQIKEMLGKIQEQVDKIETEDKLSKIFDSISEAYFNITVISNTQ